MKTSSILIKGTVPFLIFFVTWGCGKNESQSKSITKPKLVLVRIEELQPHPLQSTVEIIGTIEPKRFARMIAQSDGSIEKLFVRENDLVLKNQIVGILSSTDRLALLGETQARLQGTKLDSTENNEETRMRATEDRDRAEHLLLGTPIVSPMGGRVIDKPIEEGSIVSAKQLLLTVADLSQLIVRTAVSELLLPRLKTGQKISVRLDAYQGQEFNGTISLISPQVDPATRTGEIEVRVADAAGRLKPGMLATLTIVTERRANALAIPSDAIIIKSDGQSVVFVAQDSVAHLRVITTGLITKTHTEIRDGLHAGDKVVVMGQELLKDGLTVKVRPPKKDAVKTSGNPRESAR